MNSNHFYSKVTYASITPSKIAGTKKWKTVLDQDAEKEVEEISPLHVHQPEPKNFKRIHKSTNIRVFEDNRKEKTTEFYNRLEELKIQQQETMKLLKKLSSSDDFDLDRREIEREEKRRSKEVKFRDDLDENPEEEEDLSVSIFKQMKQKKPIKNVDEILKKMWENFDYEDYMDDIIAEEDKVKQKHAKKRVVFPSDNWKPIVTVPKPFEMTVREEKKTIMKEKRKSLTKKEEESQVDYVHRHRAKSAPATTFIPLFEEIQETMEQRSRENRKNAFAATMSIQAPFSFDEREKMRREEKEKAIAKKKKQEEKVAKQMCKFRATPLKPEVFDPVVYDRLEEDEMFRKIKGRIRTDQMFFSSTLPPRMKLNREKEAKKREQKIIALQKEQEFSFRPASTEMPDFDQLHRQERMRKRLFEEKAQRRKVKDQPFKLCSTNRKVPCSCSSTSELNEKVQNNRPSSARPSSARSYRFSSETNNPFPTRMSDASRKRMEKIRTSLDAAQKQLDDYKQEEQSKKEKQKKLRKEVAYNISVIDASKDPDLEERARKNRRELREQQKEYDRFLKDVKHRVDKRPLLVNLHDRKIVEDQAERRYQEIMYKSTSNIPCRRFSGSDSFERRHDESDGETILASTRYEDEEHSIEESVRSKRKEDEEQENDETFSQSEDHKDESEDEDLEEEEDTRSEEVQKKKHVDFA